MVWIHAHLHAQAYSPSGSWQVGPCMTKEGMLAAVRDERISAYTPMLGTNMPVRAERMGDTCGRSGQYSAWWLWLGAVRGCYRQHAHAGH